MKAYIIEGLHGVVYAVALIIFVVGLGTLMSGCAAERVLRHAVQDGVVR